MSDNLSNPMPGSANAHGPRVARSATNQPLIADHDRPNENKPVRPVQRWKKPRARRMNLSLTRVDAWSVAKVTFLLALAGALIKIVAVLVLWTILKIAGVFDQLTTMVSSAGLDAGGINLANVLSLPTVLGGVTLFSIVEMVLITIVVSIFALLYNVVCALVGGVHITLGDD
ncbi:hypothetical protein D2E26_1343 [Bifidobacterium dolichotidis]|uniref:DUF3566 domain-containing protein n=1 Tax=Bifidobacterium dolichotidis TaxID=2306976 RepID=A0A430FNX8_9BIFI|nr:DUF3566 domain-containing protein [Bifidobacterium dolichotidis]RSX54543.1 hypothetical protein D2E26_1343 [Bifidobacterium dolichotidis]